MFTQLKTAIVIQPDGKIVVGGSAGIGNYKDFGLARYNADGSPDISFGNNGKSTVRGTNFDDGISGIALQPDGKIVGAGYSFTGISNHFAVLRCNPDGSPDTSFDSDGVVSTSMGSSDWATTAVIQPDGKIFAIGFASINTYDVFAVARYNIDGTLDSSFDGDGKLTTAVNPFGDRALDAALQPDGKLLVVGYSLKQIALVRYNTDGSLDAEFNNTGIATTAVGTIEDKAFAVALLANGKIVVAGSTFDGTSGRDFVIARYEANGSLDRTFGPPGRVTTSFRNDLDSANGVAIQADGKIVVVGNSRNAGGYKDFAAARYNSSGELDMTFGSGGRVITSVNPQNDEAAKVALQADGKIVVAGYSGKNELALVRYNPNGTLDTTFDNDGKVTLSIQAGTTTATDLVIQTDGKIVITGLAVINFSADFALVRFNSNGSLDMTFDGDGIVTTPVTERADYANALALQPDGKLIVAGTVEATASNRAFGLVRYNSDGSLDASFGGTGKVITQIGDGSAEANAIALQADGKIVAAGFTSSNSDFAVVRYNANGALDTTFAANGIITTTVTGNSIDNAYDVLIQRNGKIVIAGVTVFPSSDFNIALVRYNANGSLDQSFNGDGIAVTDYGSIGEAVYAAALQKDGKIVVVGGINSVSRRDFALLRYLGDDASFHSTLFDYDGDGRADVSVFRPSDGVWFILNSTSGFYAIQFGATGDKIVPADYDGDGKTDVAVYRNGNWLIQRSSLGFASLDFGSPGDIPVPADYDGDGKSEIAVYRPSSGDWLTLNLVNNAFSSTQFGAMEDKPVTSDYDGDGKSDYAVYRPSNGAWYMMNSRDGFFAIQFGSATDKPVPGDYDGDGRADVAVYRASEGYWYVFGSRNGLSAAQFGDPSDIPVPADYDRDGKTDIAVYRPEGGNWYMQKSTEGFGAVQFGVPTDKPVPNAFVP